MTTDTDEIEVKGNHPEPTPKGIAEDLSGGLSGAALSRLLGVTKQTVSLHVCNGTITQWLKKQEKKKGGSDSDGICWRYDSEKKLFFPLD